jgi:hypothetical protein
LRSPRSLGEMSKRMEAATPRICPPLNRSFNGQRKLRHTHSSPESQFEPGRPASARQIKEPAPTRGKRPYCDFALSFADGRSRWQNPCPTCGLKTTSIIEWEENEFNNRIQVMDTFFMKSHLFDSLQDSLNTSSNRWFRCAICKDFETDNTNKLADHAINNHRLAWMDDNGVWYEDHCCMMYNLR